MAEQLTGKDEIREAVRERYAAAASSVEGGAPLLRTLGGRGRIVRLRHRRPGRLRRMRSGRRSTRSPTATRFPTPRSSPRSAAATRPRSPSCTRARPCSTSARAAASTCLLSARRVGPSGKAYGVDMTDEMLELARAKPARGGRRERRVPEGDDRGGPAARRLGRRGDLQLRDQPLRRQAGASSARRRGCCGRAGASRSPTSSPTPDMDEATRRDMAQWTGCIAGALTEEEFRARPRGGRLRATSRSARPTASTTRPARRSSGRRVAAMSTAETLALKDPQQLYLDWEHAHWASQDIDLEPRPGRLGRAGGRRARPPLLRAQLADGRRGADLDPVLRPGARPGRRGGGRASSPPSWSTRSATCSSTRASRTR